MPTRIALVASLLLSLVATNRSEAQSSLSVVSARPAGETSDLGESREVTVVFSEPMVALGRIPDPVIAPFFTIQPAIAGTFRWSGTAILVFTPDPKVALPYSTRYTVTVDPSATAVSGRKLTAPYTFAFTTPTVKLLATNWYRRNERFDGPLVIGLRFNQPVRAADLLQRLTLAYKPHDWSRPAMSAAARARLQATDPAGLAAFEAKVAAAAAAAAATTRVVVSSTATWDQRRLGKPEPTLIVLQTTTVPPPDSWIGLEVPAGMRGAQGNAPTPRPQTYTAELEPTFFVDEPHCTARCDPDRWNPLRLRGEVLTADIRKAIAVTDISTATSRPVAAKAGAPPEGDSDRSQAFTLEDLGYDAQKPASRYAMRLDPALKAIDGQTLGYPWTGVVENWHATAFTSFGDGHGVWESTGGTVLPFYARNFTTVKQWVAAVAPRELMPTILALQSSGFKTAPESAPQDRKLTPQADRIQSYGIELARALTGGHGLTWVAVEEGQTIPRSRTYGDEPRTRATVVQVTNLGLTVKDSPQNTLVFVTRLDNALPVEGAKISLVTLENQVAWTGTTNADGVAIAPPLPLRGPKRWYENKFEFLVTAEKDGDLAYLGSDWTEGVDPWEFGISYDAAEQHSLLRGTVFADRGVYRLGEEVHYKAILRHDTATGIKVPDAGTPVYVSVRDSQDREIDQREVKLSEWGSVEWTQTLPAEGALGNYSVLMRLRPFTDAAKKPSAELVRELNVQNEVDGEPDALQPRDSISGGFLVAAYRRPDFRVDATLTSATPFAGTKLTGSVSARYLFGAAMKDAPVRWTYSRTPAAGAPSSLLRNFPLEGFDFGARPAYYGRTELRADEDATDAEGGFEVELDTKGGDGIRYDYQIEGEVTDVSRQRIANRASFSVHPAAVYVGVKLPYFVDQSSGVSAALVALTPDGAYVPDTDIAVTVQHVQWISTRRAEGSGFYTWDTTEKITDVGTWHAKSGREPVLLPLPLKEGGYFKLHAEAKDAEGRVAVAHTEFYALGPGYTAWTRYDHNRIDLVPERKNYAPGDSARIMIKSPWEQATALVTTEREGVRTHRRFALTSSQQSITVPITEADIPNVFVSVLLVKGRSTDATPDDGSDPGKPSFRLGYVELKVEDASKRLTVTAKADKDEFRPANKAKVAVAVKDFAGKPAQSEVTLWAVDYGVLSLTAFQTPDVLKSVYVEKALQVITTDSRQRIVSRRVLTPKGGDEGGGGGEEPGAGTVRKDFRVLAFWVGSVVTDANGQASVDVTLPESLTTYRIMAVAADKASRFGSADSEIRVNKPLTMKPAFPRFLARGDKASFGAVVTSQLKAKGSATVTIKSLDPAILEFSGQTKLSAAIAAGGAVEVKFDAVAKALGKARIQMTARMGGESDAFEDVIPVEVLVSPETVAAYGDTTAEAREKVTLPAGVVAGFGGLSVELASTAMVGLGEGARYLIEYPYGCAEQRSSRALALLLAADLGEAFALPDINAKDARTISQAQLTQLVQYQCSSGGFAYWPGACSSVSPYLTAYVLHVFQVADRLKYKVDPEMMQRAYTYLEHELAKAKPENESWIPAYTAWQAFAIKVLVEGGRHQDSHVTRLYGYLDRMPVFGLTYLADALVAKGEGGPRLTELRRRIKNAVLPEGGSAHVEELNDPYLLWFWNSNVRSTAIVLNHQAKQSTPDLDLRAMVRWMMAARKNGRWGNTQENALAMEALVTYYRTQEADVPDFSGAVTFGGDKPLVQQAFKGRSATATIKTVPMQTLLVSGPAGTSRDLTFAKTGTGRLFYVARLKYAVDAPRQQGLDSGFAITRTYEPTEAGAKGATGPATTSYKAGDLVRVTLSFDLTKERRYVAVVDPLPAGFEPVESWFATTARDLAGQNDDQSEPSDWWLLWEKGGFDHVEKFDDQVRLFATRLSEGHHEFSYIVRATTAGAYSAAPAHVEEMYEPEVFGRTATAAIDVKK
jgi:alpha-2-macroglobulin